MQNGDRYFGKVLSLNNDTLVIQSDVLGSVRLPRGRVALITLGASVATNHPVRAPALTNSPLHAAAMATTNGAPEFSAALRQLGVSSNLLQKVQSQFLSGAGPEAKNKFNELAGGLISGKLNVNDIRAEAKSAAAQLRAARKDLGDEASFMIDGYLAILDRFINETERAGGSATNSASPPARPKPGLSLEEE